MRSRDAAFVRFVVVGSVTALGSAFAMLMLVEKLGMHPIAAAAVVAVAGNAWGFVMNRRWSFQATDGAAVSQFLRYMAVALFATIASIAMFAGFTALGLHYLVASLAVSAGFAICNFLAHFHWSFATRRSDRHSA